MSKNSRQTRIDRRNPIRTTGHLTRPPRLEGKVKEAMMQPVKKPKKTRRSSVSRRSLVVMSVPETGPIRLVEKRIERITQKLKKLTNPRDASTFKCAVSVNKAVRHHRQGKVFQAAVNLEIAGKLMSAKAFGETPAIALDSAYDEIRAEYVHFKDKVRSRARREGARIKETLVA